MVSSDQSQSFTQGTKVDLGEDLLETTTITRPQADELQGQAKLDDWFQSAKILAGESLYEEAKKVLRKIILADPHFVPARKKLDEIHEIELKQIFGDSVEPRKPGKVITPRGVDPSILSSEEVMRKLDADLELGIFPDSDGVMGEAREMERHLFGSAENMESFAAQLELQLGSLPEKDRLDIGIAFMEMGLYDLAIRQFRVAMRDSTTEVAADTLLAQALLMAERPFEAALSLETSLGNPELDPDQRVHFLYLSARANDRLGKKETAKQRYQQVLEIDPHHRDVQDRMSLLNAVKPKKA